jgi:hypothetical protein
MVRGASTLYGYSLPVYKIRCYHWVEKAKEKETRKKKQENKKMKMKKKNGREKNNRTELSRITTHFVFSTL